ncbi:hypothetical protein CDAR_19221 [Caerostris darwini]|uniref:Uncharacterized protein n=1 Tax=Caerostris darwini TaxID=1538125 RepID=A0AAV4WC93_9ARAC|nr:hypothetical protein CDAR_19221 [Caerostris darwini]
MEDMYADNTEDGKNEDSIEVETVKQNSRPGEAASTGKNLKTLVKEEVTEDVKTAEPELSTKLSTDIKTHAVAKSELLSNMEEIKSPTTTETGKAENSLKENIFEKLEETPVNMSSLSSEITTTENHSEEYIDEIAEVMCFNKTLCNIDGNMNSSEILLMNGHPEPEVAESFTDNPVTSSINGTSKDENVSNRSMVEEEAKTNDAEREEYPEEIDVMQPSCNFKLDKVSQIQSEELINEADVPKQIQELKSFETGNGTIASVQESPTENVNAITSTSNSDNHDAPSVNETSKVENRSNQSIVEEAKTNDAEREEYPEEIDEMQPSSNFKLDEISQIQSEALDNKIDVPNQNQEAKTDVPKREDYPGEADEMQLSSNFKLDKISQMQSEVLVNESDVPNQNRVKSFENTNGTIASAEELPTESVNVTTSTTNEVVNDGTISTEESAIITNSIDETETINKCEEITVNELNSESSTIETEPRDNLMTTQQPSSAKCINEDNTSIVLERPKNIKAELVEDIPAYHPAVDITFIYACY